MRNLLILSSALTVLAAGCATLFNAQTKSVPMQSDPAAAEVWINDVHRGVTPVTLDLNNHESHVVVFRKEGYEDVVCELTASIGVGWIVLDVLGGLVPVVVDAATGEWNRLDQDSCNVTLPSADDFPAPDPTQWTRLLEREGLPSFAQ